MRYTGVPHRGRTSNNVGTSVEVHTVIVSGGDRYGDRQLLASFGSLRGTPVAPLATNRVIIKIVSIGVDVIVSDWTHGKRPRDPLFSGTCECTWVKRTRV